MKITIQILMLVLAIIYRILAVKNKDKKDDLHYDISSDIFTASLLLSIMI